jgi:hypothetical protein
MPAKSTPDAVQGADTANAEIAAARLLAGHFAEVFRDRYAPAELKSRTIGWSLERELGALRTTIDAQPSPSKSALQRAFRQFFQATHDIHTFIEMADDRAVWLGVHLLTTDAGVRVAWIDPKFAPQMPLVVGDEITTFDGEPTGQAIQRIAKEDGLHSTPGYELAYAERFLGVRSTSDLPTIPRTGSRAVLGVRRKGEPSTIELVWRDLDAEPPSERCPFWKRAPQSMLPPLGKVLWKSDPSARFGAYVFEADGHHYGFVRLQSYGTKDEVRTAIVDFDKAIDEFIAHRVVALVIDQRGNDGGDAHFGYTLLARLLDHPLIPTKQKVLVRGDEVVGVGPRADLRVFAERLDAARTDEEARAALDAVPLISRFVGYARRDLVTARAVASFYHFFEEKPSGLTAPHFELIPEFGPDPARGPILATPILMLIDSIDHSAADFVPATLQDNHRGVLFGTNTAGAGGNQAHVGMGDVCTPSRSRFRLPCAPPDVIAALKTLGFSGFYYTVAVAVRAGDRVIENVGVSPDVPYRIQAEDLLTGFTPMRRRILDTLKRLASSVPASR